MKSFIATAALLGAVTSGHASVVTFDDLVTGGIDGNRLTLTVDGVSVTIAGPGLQVRDFAFRGVGQALSTHSDAGPITITFEGGYLADNVGFSNPLNVNGDEVDRPVGTAYDAQGVMIATFQSGAPFHFLAGPGIASVVYREGARGEGFVMGDFQFNVTPPPPVPEPEAAGLALAGLGVLAAARRRSRSQGTQGARQG